MSNPVLGHLQPGVDKNSEDLAILILGFDGVTGETTHRWMFIFPDVSIHFLRTHFMGEFLSQFS